MEEAEEVRAIHKRMTDKQALKIIKELYKRYPEVIMHPDKWLKERRFIRKEEKQYE